MASQPVSSDLQPLETENYHDANFVIIDGIGGCIYGKLWCRQW